LIFVLFKINLFELLMFCYYSAGCSVARVEPWHG
jgi:hypothetical protein